MPRCSLMASAYYVSVSVGRENGVLWRVSTVGASESSSNLCDTKSEPFRYYLCFHDLYQRRVLQLDRHHTAVFCLPSVDHLM